MTFDWNEKKVFVTGATGLLGTWLCKDLHEKGAQVVALVRDFVPNSDFFRSKLSQKVTIVRGELEDLPLLQRALNEYEIEACFHLGAQTIVGTAARSPISTFESNIRGTWQVLEAARLSPLLKCVIVASSDKAYGDQKKLPYDEKTPLEGRFPYDASKSCADLITQSYHCSYGLNTVIARCGNLFGGGDLNFNRLVPGTIQSIWKNETPIIRSNGKYVRDYVYVKDAVSAYEAMAENARKKGVSGEAFNFGNDKPLSVVEMVEKISRLMGSSKKPKILNEASREILNQYLNSKKARETLGWKPAYTLEEGLNETIAWYTQFLEQKSKRA